jgi:tetrahydromethanopterin S-methyltransferase subunit G
MTEYEATFTQRATFAAFFQTRSSTGGTHFKGSVYLTPNARVGTPPPEDKQAAARAYTKTQVAYFKKEVGKLQAKLDANKELQQKDLEAIHKRIDALDKRLDDQVSRVSDIGSAVDRFGILVTVLLAAAGLAGYVSVVAKSRREAVGADRKLTH